MKRKPVRDKVRHVNSILDIIRIKTKTDKSNKTYTVNNKHFYRLKYEYDLLDFANCSIGSLGTLQ